MNDDDNKNLGEELAAAFEADMDVTENPVAPAVDDAANPEDPATPPAPNGEEPKKDDPENPDKKDEESETSPTDPSKPKEEDPANPQAPAAPGEEDQPKPLTEDGVMRIINETRLQERNSEQELRNTYNDVMESYYPDGLSNVLVDQNSGKELRTPQDVVDASGGELSHEQAAQWLLNEQYKLDNSIKDIQRQAAQIAETTVTFKRDATAALQKYEPLFKAYPSLQPKVFDLMMRQVKADEKKGVILQAPDVMDLYDTYLEPYQKAYEFSTNKPATNPVNPEQPPAPAPTPSINDRLDEGGDGGQSPVDDPEDFAQQVEKELSKPF